MEGWAVVMRVIITRPGKIIHEVARNSNLGTDVAKLGPDAKEESVLFAERAWVVFCDGVFLVVHICILKKKE